MFGHMITFTVICEQYHKYVSNFVPSNSVANGKKT